MKTTNKHRWIAIVLIIIIMAVLALILPRGVMSPTVEAQTEVATTTVSVEANRPILSVGQEEFIKGLGLCESTNRSHIKILDVNGKYSYGEFQFQMGTFLGFGKQYGILPEGMTAVEAEAGAIFDSEIQRKIVHEMLSDGLGNHWFNCYHKLGGAYPVG